MEVFVKCKRCNRMEPSSKMVVDPVYKMAVCTQCVRDRLMNSQPQKKDAKSSNIKPTIVKPALNVAPPIIQHSIKVTQQSQKVKRTCAKCGFPYSFDVERQVPKNCPYCNRPVEVKE